MITSGPQGPIAGPGVVGAIVVIGGAAVVGGATVGRVVGFSVAAGGMVGEARH